MLLELLRHAIDSNRRLLLKDFYGIERLISASMTKTEDDINKLIYRQLGTYQKDLGTFSFKNRQYSARIESETSKSHGKQCQMNLPSRIRTELGDLIIAVDHILDDDLGRKTVCGITSFIQTKKESYVMNKGLSLRQLYLMTYWPEFTYKKKDWAFDVVADPFAFYLFISDRSQKSDWRCTNMLSGSLIVRLLGINEIDHIKDIEGEYRIKNMSFFTREKIEDSWRTMPFTFSTFLFKSLYSSLGSQSQAVRQFLRTWFFSNLSNIHDCHIQGIRSDQSNILAHDTIPKEPFHLLSDDDEDIYAVLLKVILRRIE